MNDCIFCKIIAKKIPSEIIFEDEEVIVFKDINPKAEVHLLIVPKTHIESILSLEEKELAYVSKMVWTAKKIAEKENLTRGYKLLFNCSR